MEENVKTICGEKLKFFISRLELLIVTAEQGLLDLISGKIAEA